ncbi:hypothetical protein [Exiguobacterium indicum]|nr:hypothetical protein [Exiguobacterium indicum]
MRRGSQKRCAYYELPEVNDLQRIPVKPKDRIDVVRDVEQTTSSGSSS